MFWEKLKDCCAKSIKVALIVGALLSLVNQGPAFMTLNFPPETIIRIFMNFLIPFSVATYSRMALLKEQSPLGDLPVEDN